MPMRELLHDAIADARDVVGNVVTDLRAENQLTDDEVLVQYEQIRGDIPAMLQYAAQQVGPGADVMAEAMRYEAEMEKLRRAKGSS